MTLFAPSARQQLSQNLVEFRAGKMDMKENNMVHPDKRKGLVYIHQANDMLMHFCWKDRSTEKVEDDLIIFPGDAEFKKVAECKTGRVFLLRMKGTGRKYFFWMQEPQDKKDDDNFKKVNDLLNNGVTAANSSAAGSTRSALGRLGAGRGAGLGGVSAEQLQGFDSLFGMNSQLTPEQLEQFTQAADQLGVGSGIAGIDDNQLIQLSSLLGGGAGLNPAMYGNFSGDNAIGETPNTGAGLNTALSTAAGTASAGESNAAAATESDSATPRPGGTAAAPAIPGLGSARGVQLSDLQSILSGMNIPAGAMSSEGGGPAVHLEDALRPSELLDTVLPNESHVSALLPHLPEEQPITQNREELAATLRSPQLRQAIGMFGSALQTAQLGPLLSQFGLPRSAVDAAERGDIQSFAEMLSQSESTSAGGASTAQEADKEEKEKKEKTPTKPGDKKDKDEEMELD